jgi:hypothetical protein
LPLQNLRLPHPTPAAASFATILGGPAPTLEKTLIENCREAWGFRNQSDRLVYGQDGNRFETSAVNRSSLRMLELTPETQALETAAPLPTVFDLAHPAIQLTQMLGIRAQLL